MPENDSARMQPGDIAAALALLTRLPVVTTSDRGARAAWAWPIAGAVTALIAAVLGWLSLALGLPPGLTAALILATMILLTGALHEDGLADCADGFWGGADPTRRLQIMKDSAIGTYGTLGLILVLLARWSAILALINAGWLVAPLITAALLSRVPMVAVMAWMEPARGDGLSHGVGRPDAEGVLLAVVVALLIALPLAGFTALAAALVVAVLGLAVALIARAKIAGQTGDVLGATQQIAEVGALAVLAACAT